MPKFTEMENINYSVKQKLTENAKEEFTDLLYSLQDYISNDFYNEKVENPEQVSKIYNTISDLKAKFSDYESEADEDEKPQVSDYYSEMYDVIDALKDFADSGDNMSSDESKEDDYATEVDEAFNENPDSIFEQIGLAKEGE